MAMIGTKDKPTYYNIVGKQSGAVLATAPASKVIQLKKKLQQESKEELEIVLIIQK